MLCVKARLSCAIPWESGAKKYLKNATCPKGYVFNINIGDGSRAYAYETKIK